jgi:hypothetical protein
MEFLYCDKDIFFDISREAEDANSIHKEAKKEGKAYE